jgi:hypothetical protein
MEYGFATHVLMWIIAVMTVGSVAGVVAGFWAMGRSGYRKD